MFKTEKEIGQTPDKWVILKYVGKDGIILSVFGGWGGGYLHGQSWKRSSAIKSVTRQDGMFIAETESGSTYNLRVTGIGYTTQTASMATSMREAAGTPGDFKLEILDELEDVTKHLESILRSDGDDIRL